MDPITDLITDPIQDFQEPSYPEKTTDDIKRIIACKKFDNFDRSGMASTSSSQFELGLFYFARTLHLCSSYPSILGPRRSWVLINLGWTNRMLGRYDQAQVYLQQAMDEMERDDYIYNTTASGQSRWIYARAELAMTKQLMGRLEEAGSVWREMYEMSKTSEADLKKRHGQWVGAYSRLECMCRAVGNVGVVSYLLAVGGMERVDSMGGGEYEGEAKEEAREEAKRLLGVAVESLKERIKLAVKIREGYRDMDDQRVNEARVAIELWPIELSPKIHQARAWQVIGYSRLSLAYSSIARLGGPDVNKEQMKQLSIEAAREGVRLARVQRDTSVTALAHFYYGKALLANEQKEQAMEHLNLRPTQDTSSRSSSMNPGICTPAIALCKQPSAEHRGYLQELVGLGVDLTLLDKHGYSAMDYAVFIGDSAAESILAGGLKTQLGGDEQKVALLQEGARLQKGYRELFQEKLRPVLLKYQSRRNCLHGLRSVYAEALDTDAVELFLQDHPKVKGEKLRSLRIWMDFACVDQDNPSAGVAALPMILAQCDAVISLVDDEYYDRAWCSVEALLVQKLKRAYDVHLWYEHVLLPVSTVPQPDEADVEILDPGRPARRWALRRSPTDKYIDMAKKKLSLESDRPRVMFLERQSRLLGRGKRERSQKKSPLPSSVLYKATPHPWFERLTAE